MKRAELLRMQKQAKARKGQAVSSIRTQDVLELIRLALKAPPEGTAVEAVRAFKRDFSTILKGHVKLWGAEYDRLRSNLMELTYDHGLVEDAFDTLTKTSRIVDKLRRKAARK
jgi:hypothetical protein